MFRDECLLCKSRDLKEVINLGMHPMADTFVPMSRLSEPDRLYPLIVDLCERCGQIQLRAVTNPSERYVECDYSYTSSNSRVSREHWTHYAEEVAATTGLQQDDVVVEIGSNDGFLSAAFQKRGYRVLGVDPSPAMAALAAARDVKTYRGLFETKTAEELLSSLPARPRLICANNVFNHSNDPLDFAKSVKSLLAEDGTFVFELPYWLNLVEQKTFDQIYHEHVTYFTVTYSINLFHVVGMKVVGAQLVDYHGGSIRVYVRYSTAAARCNQEFSRTIETLAEREQKLGLFKAETYAAFRQRVLSRRNAFLEKLYRIKNSGYPVVCVGAAAKGNTFLNYYDLDAFTIDYVTDASDQKIGKYTPGTRIPIASDEVLHDYGRVYAIVTSWNIAKVLETKLSRINSLIEYLNPYSDREAQ